jgi:hypothetical protein
MTMVRRSRRRHQGPPTRVNGTKSGGTNVLDIAVTSPATDDATAVAQSWRGDNDDDVRVEVIAWIPDLSTSARYQLVVGIDGGHVVQDDHEAIDVWTNIANAPSLWRERLRPFHDNLAANRRARRRQVVVPDPGYR